MYLHVHAHTGGSVHYSKYIYTRLLASSTIFNNVGEMAAFFGAGVEKCVDLGHPVSGNNGVLEG